MKTLGDYISKLSNQYNLQEELARKIIKKVLLDLLNKEFPGQQLTVKLKDELQVFYIKDKKILPLDIKYIPRHIQNKILPLIEGSLKTEATKDTYEKFKDKTGEMFLCNIIHVTHEKVVLDINGYRGVLPQNEQIPKEIYNKNQNIWCFLKRVNENDMDTLVFSRMGLYFIKLLLGEIIPDIRNGNVNIMRISREAGFMCKVVVDSSLNNTIGTCLGLDNCYYQELNKELSVEKIKFVEYSSNPIRMIRNAIGYNNIIDEIIIINQVAYVKSMPEKSRLLIGYSGNNIKLAARVCQNVKKIHVLEPAEFNQIIEEQKQEEYKKYLENLQSFENNPDQIDQISELIHEYGLPSEENIVHYSNELAQVINKYQEHLEQIEVSKYLEQYGSNQLYEFFKEFPISLLYTMHENNINKVSDLMPFNTVHEISSNLNIDNNLAFLIFNKVMNDGHKVEYNNPGE